jgi:hypothetical protein
MISVKQALYESVSAFAEHAAVYQLAASVTEQSYEKCR